MLHADQRMLRGVEAKLYVILGSHACRTGMLMLDHKGIDYEVVELPTGLHPFVLRLRGFSGNRKPFRQAGDKSPRMLAMADRSGTVPALKIDGRRVKTNREIARVLEELRPDPPFYPADPDRRRAVEEAERWGDEVFQMAARRIGLMALLHGKDGLADRGGDGRLGPMLWRHERARWFGARFVGRFVFAAADEAGEQELLDALPGHARPHRRLDRGGSAQRGRAVCRRLHDRPEPRAADLPARPAQ